MKNPFISTTPVNNFPNISIPVKDMIKGLGLQPLPFLKAMIHHHEPQHCGAHSDQLLTRYFKPELNKYFRSIWVQYESKKKKFSFS